MDEATLSAELIKLRGIGEQPTPFYCLQWRHEDLAVL